MEEGFEGWYSDPYGRHEARWMSDGRPTKLVRDDGVEAYDDPPDEAPSQTPTRIDVEVAPGSGTSAGPTTPEAPATWLP